MSGFRGEGIVQPIIQRMIFDAADSLMQILIIVTELLQLGYFFIQELIFHLENRLFYSFVGFFHLLNRILDFLLKKQTQPILDLLLNGFKFELCFAGCALALSLGLRDGDVGVEEEDFVDLVGIGVKDRVCKIFKALVACLQGISLKVGVVQCRFEPLRTKVALELIGFDIVLLPHVFSSLKSS